MQPKLKTLKAVPITPENFKPFGQLIGPIDDMKPYDQEDAQLQGFDAGTPRFYIMRLPERGLKFDRITYHGKVTQCLGLLSPIGHWYMVVAAPTHNVEAFPKEQDLMAFKIPHGVFVKMHKATWHAGPLFTSTPHMDFYNLELSDTNVVDHNTHDFRKTQGIELEVSDV